MLKFIKKVFPVHLDYGNFIFIPIFFSFYLLLKTFGLSEYILTNFSGRPISMATNEGLDIGSRVSLFYKGILFVTILLFLFTRLTIIVKKYIVDEELRIANGLSLAGFCLLFFRLIGADMKPTIHLIFAMMIVCTAGFVYHNVSKRVRKNYLSAFLWSVITAIACYFILWEAFLVFNIQPKISLPAFVSVVGSVLYILFSGHNEITNRIIISTQPLVMLPLLSFLSMEIYMILNQHGMYCPPWVIFTCGLVVILILVAGIYRKNNFDSGNASPEIFFRKWIPWLLTGLFCIAFYTPTIKPEIDFFEDANHVLPLHQWFAFDKVPLLDSFSSHALSDFGFGLLYSFFNGADPMGVYVYSFFMGIIILLVVYCFVYKITGDGFMAVWITLAYPYAGLLLPSYFNLVPLAAWAFLVMYERQTTGSFFLFFFVVIMMVAWRIDLGSSTLVAAAGSLIILATMVPGHTFQWKKMLKGLFLMLSLMILIFIIALSISGPHLFIAMKDVLAYISSFQSYGLKDLSYNHDMKYFSLYYVLPSAIILIIASVLYNILRQKYNGRAMLLAMSIIFLGIFYFSNLQRGLVRHTLAETWNMALTSYGFFIISAYIFLMMRNSLPVKRFFVFFISSTIIIINYSFSIPDLTTNNNYSYVANKLFFLPKIEVTRSKINRIESDKSLHGSYAELVQWMDKYLSSKSTFLDFSNTPMLYYFANRMVPNYLVQIPHTAHNEYLQSRFLEDLKNYDIPAVVFSNYPLGFWDYLDGIPNTLRHYRISEYIYKNYSPAYIISNHSVWLRKENKERTEEKELLTIKMNEMMWDGASSKLFYRFASPIYSEGKIYLKLNVTSIADGDMELWCLSSKGNYDENRKQVLKIRRGKNELLALLQTEQNDLGAILLKTPSGIKTDASEIKIVSSELIRDYASMQPVNYSLKWLPYIWGTFDENYLAGKIVSRVQLINENIKLNPQSYQEFDIHTSVDKSSGNYLMIRMRPYSKKETQIKLGYGNNEEEAGSFSFSVKADTAFHDYLIRVSSQYNWFMPDISKVNISCGDQSVEVAKLEILQGD